MKYLNEKDIHRIGINWNETIDTINSAVKYFGEKDFAQPVKPYLRYRDPQNRIIAMPAFIGGKYNKAGLKWIASFPQNIDAKIPRAHSIVILNNADTGVPECIINTGLLSIVRTASVSGLIIRYYEKCRQLEKVNIGIIGWGPIGQYHFKMITDILGDKISKIYLYDLRPIDMASIDYADKSKIVLADSWETVYENTEIFITCTVSKEPYIDKKPKSGGLYLNVSLRDFKPAVFEYFKNTIFVDDWEEVCREKTDVEMFHLEKGLEKEDSKNIINIINGAFGECDPDEAILFNPMGMALFDIAIGTFYQEKAKKADVGLDLE